MKIISWNVNGLRSVVKKGFLDWVNKEALDIICLQEIMLHEADLPWDLRTISSYQSVFNGANKKGYAGVVVYSNKAPLKIDKLLGNNRFDQEGRMLELEFPGFTLINLYLPHGGRDKSKLEYKLEVYQKLLDYLKTKKNQPIVLVGDFNIAHEEIDLARPKDNQNNIMFTSEERSQITQLLALGFIDTFRQFEREGGHYTWWPYYRQARERNLGWRLDYCFVSKILIPKLKTAFILPRVFGSDHCPIGVEIR